MKKRYISSALLCTLLFLVACSSNSSSIENNNATNLNDITPIVTSSSSSQSDTYIQNETTSSEESLLTENKQYHTEPVPEELRSLFSENFAIIDNSDGTANVYEIKLDNPFHYTTEWDDMNLPYTTSLPYFEADNWMGDANLITVKDWFLGTSFNAFSLPTDNSSAPREDTELITYAPPVDTFPNTVKKMHVESIGSISQWEELPFCTYPERIDSGAWVACFDLDGDAFPRDARPAPDKPLFYPEEHDTLHMFCLADKYIDGIPVFGSLYPISYPTGVYDYEDILQTARPTSLIARNTIPYRNGNNVVVMVRTGEFSIQSTIRSNLPIKSVYDCIDGIEDAVNYLINIPPVYYTIDTIHIYAAELAYLPLCNFDVEALDFSEDAITYLVPVWNIYFEPGQYCPYCCLTIDAITGESLYSKEYSVNDRRLEIRDGEI